MCCVLFMIIVILNSGNNSVFAGSKESTIAGIVVEDLSDEEIRDVLKEAIVQWSNEQITIEGGGNSLQLTITNLQFDVEATIRNYRAQSKKTWYSFWTSSPVVTLPLEMIPSEKMKQQISTIKIWDTNITYDALLSR